MRPTLRVPELRPLHERIFKYYHKTFWDSIAVTESSSDCWECLLALNKKDGKGHCTVSVTQIAAGCSRMFAHRIAFMLTWGEIPDGAQILHTCGNNRCCNPFHLYAGTDKHNIQDAIDAGTHSSVVCERDEYGRWK